MFFPYKDINPTERTAFVTIAIIVINITVFIFQILGNGPGILASRELALIPLELTGGNLPDSMLLAPPLSAVTYMFVHGGVGHIVFNMLFLWIFGNNIEDSMTRPRFLGFYLVTGIISGLAFALMYPESNVSLVGASGAISGVLGAYLLLYPFAKVHVLFIVFPIRMPAVVFIVIWFVMQISGLMNGAGNVAWISHISGFIAGLVLYRFFLVKK